MCSAFILFLYVLLASAHFEDPCRPCTGMLASVCVLHVTVFSVHFFKKFQMFTFLSFLFSLSFCFKLCQSKNSTANTSSSTHHATSAVVQCSGSAVPCLNKKQGHCYFFCICHCSQQIPYLLLLLSLFSHSLTLLFLHIHLLCAFCSFFLLFALLAVSTAVV